MNHYIPQIAAAQAAARIQFAARIEKTPSGWVRPCPECEGHGAFSRHDRHDVYGGYCAYCDTCDECAGDGVFEATTDDFDGMTVRVEYLGRQLVGVIAGEYLIDDRDDEHGPISVWMIEAVLPALVLA